RARQVRGAGSGEGRDPDLVCAHVRRARCFCAWPSAANRQRPAVILSESTTALSTPHKSTDSDIKSYGPHQRNRVARLHDAGPEPVVEVQMPIGEMILEMNVGGARSEVGGDVAERQVVRRHQADG